MVDYFQEKDLCKIWKQAYARTTYRTTDVQLESNIKQSFPQYDGWIGYSWHLCSRPREIYKCSLELWDIFLTFIPIHQRPQAMKAAVYKTGRRVIEDLQVQLQVRSVYTYLRDNICQSSMDPVNCDLFLTSTFLAAFICAWYCLLQLCYTHLPSIDQFWQVILTIIHSNYTTMTSLLIEGYNDLSGNIDYIVPPYHS